MSSYDADDFTKKYLSDNYGITDFNPLLIEDPDEQQALQNTAQTPLVPKPPKKQFQKMLDNDRKILRFSATLTSNKQEDKDRVFVVSYYLADDTVGIYEPPQRLL